MATYVLIHGAGSDGWYWHRVTPLLRARGHEVIAPDLPVDDDAAGLAEYADAVVEAIGDRRKVILVAQSMAGFTAPKERLGLTPDEMDGGHLPALSRPEELVERLEAYRVEEEPRDRLLTERESARLVEHLGERRGADGLFAYTLRTN